MSLSISDFIHIFLLMIGSVFFSDALNELGTFQGEPLNLLVLSMLLIIVGFWGREGSRKKRAGS